LWHNGGIVAPGQRACAGRGGFADMQMQQSTQNPIPEIQDRTVAFQAEKANRTLFSALLDAVRRHGRKTQVLDDPDKNPLNYDRLLLGATVLGRAIAKISMPGEKIGVLLPNGNGVAVTFFALHAYGRVPAMLNFTSGAHGLLGACKAAQITTILTARRFIRLAELEPLAEALSKKVKLVYLEDLRKTISLGAKLSGALLSHLPRRLPGARKVSPDDPGVVLFTSGTEGSPKGVVLSHRNVLANCCQCMATGAFEDDDRFFTALPVFHSFGLTPGMILPLISGRPVFLYPSPLHYKMIPPLIKRARASVMFGTDTFAAGWGRAASKEDFASLRLVVLGAERVRQKTRELWREKFGMEIYEGYGATETAPVVAVNTPNRARNGTVGPLLPQIEYEIEPVPGLDAGGRLKVRGPNVMSGYLTVEKPGVVQPPEGGWHDTGDIVEIDDDGFIAIKGRAKRFAKIGGEMISLAAVEAYVASVWPDNAHAVVAVEDARKGEKLVLITDHEAASRAPICAWAKEHHVPELQLPKHIVFVEALPVLGTGKLDYVAINTLARQNVGPLRAAAE
jgi:acyl-[acyl-carrier-protein]-phospholipid O-acyltransferase/long-chain-fatty-acid--[acyl-carrier-protein] ligase